MDWSTYRFGAIALLISWILCSCEQGTPSVAEPTPSSESSILSFPLPSPESTLQQQPPEGLIVGASEFIGEEQDAGLDLDGNGLFDYLMVDVDIEVDKPGYFAFIAVLLTADGEFVTLGVLETQTTSQTPKTTIWLEKGTQTVTIYFSGIAIQSVGADGPYTISVGLVGEEGSSLDALSFATGPYDHQAFQSAVLEILSVEDACVDQDRVPGCELLRVSVELQVSQPIEIQLFAKLSADQTFVVERSQTASLSTGNWKQDVDFVGADIFNAGLDGPYIIDIRIVDPFGSHAWRHVTYSYEAETFQDKATID